MIYEVQVLGVTTEYTDSLNTASLAFNKARQSAVLLVRNNSKTSVIRASRARTASIADQLSAKDYSHAL